jgi:hypothetical protein
MTKTTTTSSSSIIGETKKKKKTCFNLQTNTVEIQPTIMHQQGLEIIYILKNISAYIYRSREADPGLGSAVWFLERESIYIDQGKQILG